MKNYKLFCSFTGLYNLLDSGQVSFDDLRQETSLFFFGCAREHVLGSLPKIKEIQNDLFQEPSDIVCNEWLVWHEEKLERNYLWAAEFQKILLQAEKENRVSWRDRDEFYRFKEAKMFLSGFGLWLPEYDDLPFRTCNNYPGIEEALTGKVEVLWR